MSKLLCNFLNENELYPFVDFLKDEYTVLDGKIFIFGVAENDSYICTYNLELNNATNIPEGSFLVHRKKESNTLYTINALNKLIQILNNGILDKKFPINWTNYKNQLIIINQNQIKHYDTKLEKIISY